MEEYFMWAYFISAMFVITRTIYRYPQVIEEMSEKYPDKELHNTAFWLALLIGGFIPILNTYFAVKGIYRLIAGK